MPQECTKTGWIERLPFNPEHRSKLGLLRFFCSGTWKIKRCQDNFRKGSKNHLNIAKSKWLFDYPIEKLINFLLKTQLAYLRNPDLSECWIFFMTKLYFYRHSFFSCFPPNFACKSTGFSRYWCICECQFSFIIATVSSSDTMHVCIIITSTVLYFQARNLVYSHSSQSFLSFKDIIPP